jgi:hypothetical protein
MASIGNHIKLDICRHLKDQVREFYLEVLGCKSLPSPVLNLDLYGFDNGFIVGVFFRDETDILPEQDQLKAAWLEIQVSAPEEVKQRLLDFGVKQVDYEDKSRFYFQAPGGQVFRLAPMDGGI